MHSFSPAGRRLQTSFCILALCCPSFANAASPPSLEAKPIGSWVVGSPSGVTGLSSEDRVAITVNSSGALLVFHCSEDRPSVFVALDDRGHGLGPDDRLTLEVTSDNGLRRKMIARPATDQLLLLRAENSREIISAAAGNRRFSLKVSGLPNSARAISFTPEGTDVAVSKLPARCAREISRSSE
jgi:hypothetical protein